MAGRNWRGVKVSQVLPIWTTAKADMNTAMVSAVMSRLGVTNVSSYLRRFAIPNVLCAIVGAVLGAGYNGFFGFVTGALLGIAAPAALIFLAVTVLHAAAYLAIFWAAWVALYYLIRWLFYSAF